MQNRRTFLKNSAKVAALFAASNLALMANSKGETMPTTKIELKELFGNVNINSLAKSDPEFVELFQNFAFDEVFAKSKDLELKTRLKITLGSLIATQGKDAFKLFAQIALKNGVSAIEIKEITYQSTPYVGFGKSLDFINLSNEVFKENKIKLPLEPQKKVAFEERAAQGLGIQRQLFGEYIDKGNAAAPDDVKHIRTFLSANCFGDYYTRGGLDLHFRELLTLVFLVSLGGADAQVRGHIQGNLNIGHDRAFLIQVITALVPYIGYPRTLNALAALDELTLKKGKK